MSKLYAAVAFVSAVITAPAAIAQANILGPDRAACMDGASRTAALVIVNGFKTRQGTVRVRAFPANSPDLFRKEGAIEKVVIPVPASGAAAVCMPLPHAGAFAFDVRHDTNGNGGSDKSDGGGLSGNPKMSLWEVMTKHKPPVSKVAINISKGVTPVPVILNYVQGFSLGPINTAVQ